MQQQRRGGRTALATGLATIFALFILLVVLAAVLWLHAVDELAWSGPRAVYFAYLAVLSIAALGLLRWPRISWMLLILALLDLSWGVGSFALDRGGGKIASLLPPNVEEEKERFQWHPLLQAVPIPSLHITSPTGLAISHTSQGTRGREPAPGGIEGHVVVATYGGSTTYDIGVADGDTWSERLADGLGRDRFFVVNNGVPGYTTVEHVLQTAFYQNKFGRTPSCAIYYVGWNDLRNAHIPHLDPGYADFHLPSQIDSLKLRRVGGSNLAISPTLTLLERLVGNSLDSIRYSTDPFAEPMGSGDDPAVTADFERNVRTISSINRQRGIATIWVGQLVNRAAFTGEGRYGWLPLVPDREVPDLLQHLNDKLSRLAANLGDAAVMVPPESFGAADFVDNGHFSVQGARRFAEALLPVARNACR